MRSSTLYIYLVFCHIALGFHVASVHEHTRLTISRASSDNEPSTSRRQLLQSVAWFGAALSSMAPLSAVAEEETAGMVSTERVADLLRAVPTFCIVDAGGAPYMVVGEDAKVTGYFFTEYGEAERILKLADKSADKAIAEAKKDPSVDPEDLVNPWKMARISTVPLDSAVTLVTKSMYASKKGGGNYFQIAPSSSDIEDALAVDGSDDLAEGKVPLFYYEDFMIDDKSPLYFRKTELEAAYKKQNPGKALPKALVSELFSVLSQMVLSGNDDEDLKILVFVPPAESKKKAMECQRRMGSAPAFVVGQRILVL